MSTSRAGGQRAVQPFDHFILTRFNVRGRYYQSDPTDHWLRYRLALFAKYTVPSFKAQTVGTFRWLVLIDSRSPRWFRRELGILARGLFEVVDIEGAFNARAAARVVSERAAAPFVLTTRVDNDDAVARDFVEEIQKAWSPAPENHFINLVSGAQFASGRIYRRPYTQNPFITLSEPCRDGTLSTVFVRRHYEVEQHAPVTNIGSDHPLWLQVVHGGNVLTELVGLRMPAKAVSPWFGCDLDACDRPVEFTGDLIRSAARIGVRLVRKPRRLVELARALSARPAQQQR